MNTSTTRKRVSILLTCLTHSFPNYERLLPSPKNSDQRAFFADQTLAEFLGEGNQNCWSVRFV